MDNDNYTTSDPPAPKPLLSLEEVVVNKLRKLTTTRRLHINLDEPPSIEKTRAHLFRVILNIESEFINDN